MTSLPAVETHELTKTYRVYGAPVDRVTEFFSRGKKVRHIPVHALRGVSVDVKPGNALGIVGSNGAGKSTFLKILSGTSPATSGKFELRGRVASLLELGTGFHSDFTGRQNIYLNGSVIGMTRQEIREKIDEIIEFSELGEFIDAPIRTYSAGMTMRLGFSIATAIDPDILILDEILAVGDMHFQKKCIDRIYEFRQAGKSILFCSHSLYDVRQICDEVIWIRDGSVEMRGDPLDVTHAYANFERARIVSHRAIQTGIEATLPDREIQGRSPKIQEFGISNPKTHEKQDRVIMGEPIELWCEYEIPNGAPEFQIGFAWFRSDRIPVAQTSTLLASSGNPTKAPGRYRAKVQVPKVDLIQGEFYLQVYLATDDGTEVFDRKMSENPLVVVQRSRDVGLFLIDHEWNIAETDPAGDRDESS